MLWVPVSINSGFGALCPLQPAECARSNAIRYPKPYPTYYEAGFILLFLVSVYEVPF